MAGKRTKAAALTPVRLGARTIAPPPTISPEAQAYLSTMAANPRPPRPAVDDLDAWRAAITAGEAMWDPVVDDMLARSSSVVETRASGRACRAGSNRTGRRCRSPAPASTCSPPP